MQKEYFNMKEEASPSPSKGGDVFPKALLSFEKKPHHQPIYGLTPVPSPNGEGSENHCLQIKESLSPTPSPNGEGSENYCLQIKEASCQIEERLSS